MVGSEVEKPCAAIIVPGDNTDDEDALPPIPLP